MKFLGGVVFAKAKIFLFSCLAFIAGIGLASFWPARLNGFKLWWFGAAVFFLMLAVLFWRFREAGGPAPLSAVFILAAVFCLAIWRYGLSLPADAPDKISHYNGRTVSFSGYVAAEPDLREASQKLTVAVTALKQAPGRKISGKILVTAPLFPEYAYGDRLEISCAPERPEEFQGFAYDRYLARYDVYSVCYYPAIRLMAGGGGGNWFYSKIFALKKVLSGLIDAGLAEPEASLARPIVFGGQRGLDQATRENFQKAGLTHIMAVSGFNVSILAALIMTLLLGLGLKRDYAFYAASFFLAAYVVLVGLPASAARAGLMGFLVLWALKLGRLNKLTNSLILTAAILLAFNPLLLRDDAGFQLSFSAIAGLIYVYPLLDAAREKFKLPRLKGLSDGLLITLAAQVFTLPILAYDFSRISLIAPLANLAVLWAVPPLTIVILAALPLSWLLPAWSFLFFLPAYVLTKYILAVTNYLAGWPFASLEIGYLATGWLILYYFLAIALVVKLRSGELLKPVFDGKI